MSHACRSSMGLFTGRLLLAHIFLMSGVMKIVAWTPTAAHMQEEGMVFVPFFLVAAIVVEIGCGALVLLGFGARVAALGLFLFLIPVTAIFHDFWKFEGKARQNQMQHFSKNVAIMGGLLAVAACGCSGGRVYREQAESHGSTESTRPVQS